MYNLTTGSEVSQINVQLVESIIQVILSVEADQQLALWVKNISKYSLPFDSETRAPCSKGRLF